MKVFVAILAVLAATYSVRAETDLSAPLSAAIADIETASEQFAAASGSDDLVLTLGGVITAYENGLRLLRDDLRVLSLRQQELAAEYDRDSGDFSRILGTLYAMESQPAPLLFLHPNGPLAAAQTAQLLGVAAPALQGKARVLKDQIVAIDKLRSLRGIATDNLRQGLAGLVNARAALDDAIAKGDAVPALFVEDRMQVQILSATAESLTAFASELAKLPLPNFATEPILLAETKFPLPVAGLIKTAFNQPDASGLRRPGIVAEAAPMSLVTTPFDATIRFAGPFLDFGNVVILEPQAGTLLILAGIERLFRAEGDVLSKGDPIGQLGGSDTTDEEFLIAASAETGVQVAQTLYIELRKDGESVDPTPWFQQD